MVAGISQQLLTGMIIKQSLLDYLGHQSVLVLELHLMFLLVVVLMMKCTLWYMIQLVELLEYQTLYLRNTHMCLKQIMLKLHKVQVITILQ